ncbi:MAG TPA: hypothetical protein VF815_42185 [Myxococcaceae bacterium]
MSEDTASDEMLLMGAWTLWHYGEWDMKDPLVIPPVPPLEEWPKGPRKKLERILRLRRRRLRMQRT